MGSSASTWMLWLILIAPLFLGFTKSQTAYESLYTLHAFSQQQSCVQSCFRGGYSDPDCFTDVLGSAIGCANSPCSKTFAAVDECYCRGDLQSAAYEWLSVCIDGTCSIGDNAVNFANAASIYSGYCTERGFTALPASNTVGTTTSALNSDSTTATTANARSSTTSSPASAGSPNASSFSSSPSPSSTNSTTLAIAPGVVGAVAVIAILLAGVAFWKIRQKKMKVYQGPVSLTPWLDNSSSQKLRLSGGAATKTDVSPNESVSQVGSPAKMGPSYPHYPVHPSAISSNRPGYIQSTIGPGRNYSRY